MHNLFRLASRASLEGFFYKPRADRELLARVRQGPDRHHRLPVRRDPDLAADRQLREGAGQRGRVPGHLRQGELLPGADGPRPRHRDQGPRRAAAAGQGPAAADGRHQRPALHRRRRRRRARGAAVRAVRQDDGRPEPVQVRRPRLLPQVARRDARAVGRQVRAAGGLRQHPADRRALRGRPSTRAPSYMPRFPVPDGRDRADLVRQGGRAAGWPSGSRTASRRRCRSRPTSRSASSPR